MLPTLDLSFLRNRNALRRIGLVTLAAAVAGGAWGKLSPKWYRSALTVVPTKAPSPGPSTLLGGELGALAAFGGGSSDGARIAAVLEGTAVTDAVIGKFDLRKRYDATSQEAAREALWRHCSVKSVPKPNLVQLSCEDRDPRFVQELLTFFAQHGNEVFRRVSVSSASEEVRFLERRVVELRRQADEAAVRMRDFQEQHQIVDLESQAKALVNSVATLQGQRIAKQMELEFARAYSSRDEATARQLESQLSVMDEKMRDLEDAREAALPPTSGGARKGRPGMFPAATAVPRVRAEMESLYRDRKVAETTLVFALDRLESARAAEARDVSTFQVLDPPPLPTRKSRPSATMDAALGAILGLLLAALVELRRGLREGRP